MNLYFQHTARKRAFTIVEVLVVISIIAVLMAILLPSIAVAREQARRTQCASNARQLTMVAMVYADGQNGKVPYGGYESTSPAVCTYEFHRASRRILFDSYGLSNPQSWLCPSGIYTRRAQMRPEFLKTSWFTDYADDDWTLNNNSDRCNYGYWVGAARGFTGVAADTYSMPIVLRFADTQKPSTRIVWADPLLPAGSVNCGGAIITMPGNTHETNGDAKSVGATTSYVDGHVAFRPVYYGVNVMNWRGQYFTY